MMGLCSGATAEDLVVLRVEGERRAADYGSARRFLDTIKSLLGLDGGASDMKLRCVVTASSQETIWHSPWEP